MIFNAEFKHRYWDFSQVGTCCALKIFKNNMFKKYLLPTYINIIIEIFNIFTIYEYRYVLNHYFLMTRKH